MRNYKLYADDMQGAMRQIMIYTKGMSYRAFCKNQLVIDAVVRNLEIIGEAAKQIPSELRKKAPEIEWKKIVSVRNIIAHEYFAVDAEIIYDIIRNKLPALKKSITILKRHM